MKKKEPHSSRAKTRNSVDVQVRSAAAGDLPAILTFLEGACGGCWCMWPRIATRKEWRSRDGETNRAGFDALYSAGEVQAVVALYGAEVVGWCQFGPQGAFPRLTKSPSYRARVQEQAWVLACFTVAKDWRGKGVAHSLTAQAVRAAKAAGASLILGFPEPSEDDEVLRASEAWTGVAALFTEQGFRRLNAGEPGRPVYALDT